MLRLFSLIGYNKTDCQQLNDKGSLKNVRLVAWALRGAWISALAFPLISTGCRERIQGVDWTAETVVFTNQIVEVYWLAESWVDASRLSNRIRGRVTKHTTDRHYLLSQLYLDTQTCVESFIPEDEFKRILSSKEECIHNLILVQVADNYKVMDANCAGGYVLLYPLYKRNLLLIGMGVTNVLPEFNFRMTSKGAVNEFGHCFVIPSDAGLNRENQAQLQFAVFRQGNWWSGQILGGMPEPSDKTFSRTSSIPALIQAPPGQ